MLAGERSAFEFKRRGPGRLRPVEAFRGGGAERVAVPVGLMATGKDQGSIFLSGDLCEDFAEGDGIEASVGFDVDGAVNSHRKRGAQCVLHAGGADGYGDDLGFDTALTEAESFF